MNIRELFVRLTLDASGLNKASPEATKKLKEVELQGKKTEEGVGKLHKTNKEATKGLGEMALGFTALAAAIGITSVGIRSFIEDTISSDASIGRLSKNIGVSIRSIVGLRAAAEEAGGSAQEMDASLKALAKSAEDYKNIGDQSSLCVSGSPLPISRTLQTGCRFSIKK